MYKFYAQNSVQPPGCTPKILLVMKLTTLLLITAILQVSAKSFAQRVTLSERNASIEKIFDKISSQTGFDFLFTDAVLIGIKPISIDVRNAQLEDVLKKVFDGQPLEYSIGDKSVVISKKRESFLSKLKETLNIPIYVSGKITDTTGMPLPGATIKIKSTNTAVIAGKNGSFSISAQTGDELVISFIGFITQTIIVKDNLPFQTIMLHSVSNRLSEVVVSTGYQTLPKERATGSFVQLDSATINRRVSTDIISRLEGVVPGLLFNRNTGTGSFGQTDISIRGTNTLFANNQPLIVVDNFPYDGDINNINPNDIENITVLKDASAASIWGVRSGNGVIVITSKKGKRDQKLHADINANITIGDKPDLNYGPNNIPSTDFINIEQSLFSKGYYDGNLSTGYTAVTPVVQILANQRAGKITAANAASQIDALRNIDFRNQELKYFYKRSVNQQYSFNLRGGNRNSDYTFSLGNDQDLSYYQKNKNGRLTLNSLYNFYPFKNLQISAGINYTKLNFQNNNTIAINGGLSAAGHTIYPYAQIADTNGNALPIAKDYNSNFTNATNSNFLNWDYRPLEELNNADNSSNSMDNRINLGLQYNFFNHFTGSMRYQYEHAITDGQNYFSQATYYTRNLINQFTQVNADGSVTKPIPEGGILQQTKAFLTSQRARAQVNYNNIWNQNHELTIIAGAEISNVRSESNANTVYGYNKDTQTSYPAINYSTSYALNPAGSGTIPTTLGLSGSTDRYVSYFSNGAYSYLNKYTISASGRIDKSNLFGVNTNQKSVPLYSAGLAWDISKEDFYYLSWFPYLKLRATYGYNGNINKSATAVTTIRKQSATGSNYTPLVESYIDNPGNPELRWEKVRIINLGLDFSAKNNIISGSLEYYSKKGTDLFGYSPIPSSTGFTSFFGNTADIQGNGLDISLNSNNMVIGNFKWTSNLLLTYVLDKVTKYDTKTTPALYILSSTASTISPLTDKPLYALYSYRWAGLNAQTGDPQGYLNNTVSHDYANVLANTTVNDMVYNGPSRPTTFGSFRNNFRYQNFILSLNIIYKLNYYFRKTSFTSSNLPYSATIDYYDRWQKPGDELTTNVPSLQLPPFDNSRDRFYQYSSVLVDKGDHIRLQDISLSYDLEKQKWKRMPFNHIQIYSYINNVGILWRANKDHLDPDLNTSSTLSYPLPRTISFGIKAQF